jgi:hypothetical protein
MQLGDCASFLFCRGIAGDTFSSGDGLRVFLHYACEQESMEGLLVKSAMIVAALCAALVSGPVAAQAKGMTDTELYCSIVPLTSKCAPAKPAAAAVAAPAVAVAKAATVAATTAAKIGIKTMSCTKAAAGAGHLYDCTWK